MNISLANGATLNGFGLFGPDPAAAATASLRHAVHAALVADPTVVSLADARVYHGAPDEADPKGSAFVTYQVVSLSRPTVLARPLTIAAARVQVAAAGDSLASVAALAGAVRELFHGFTGPLGGLLDVVECRVEAEYDPNSPPRDATGRWTYRIVTDVVIRHREPLPARFAAE